MDMPEFCDVVLEGLLNYCILKSQFQCILVEEIDFRKSSFYKLFSVLSRGFTQGAVNSCFYNEFQ